MASVKFKDESVRLSGDIPRVGEPAPDFTFVHTDLSEYSLYDYEYKIKVIVSIPSIETGVCQIETRKFNEIMAKYHDVVVLVVSQDLPFSLKRYCGAEGLNNVVPISDFRYNDFSEEFGVGITEGAFKGLTARAVFVVDKKNVIRYAELVPEIGLEPNYDAAVRAVEKLTS